MLGSGVVKAGEPADISRRADVGPCFSSSGLESGSHQTRWSARAGMSKSRLRRRRVCARVCIAP